MSNAVDNSDLWMEFMDFAAARELEAVKFYTDLAKNAPGSAMKALFIELATIEKGHETKLIRIKASGMLQSSGTKIADLKIADYVPDIDATPGMDYQQALLVAMKREEAAHNLYEDLAAAAHDADLREAMLALAEEEAKHKLRFETEYDEFVLREN